eukprot:364262-Chlamydomonas_euryale.AAC.23
MEIAWLHSASAKTDSGAWTAAAAKRMLLTLCNRTRCVPDVLICKTASPACMLDSCSGSSWQPVSAIRDLGAQHSSG